jgi:hypothetical protein
MHLARFHRELVLCRTRFQWSRSFQFSVSSLYFTESTVLPLLRRSHPNASAQKNERDAGRCGNFHPCEEARGLRSAEDDLARSMSAVQQENLVIVTRPFAKWGWSNQRRN